MTTRPPETRFQALQAGQTVSDAPPEARPLPNALQKRCILVCASSPAATLTHRALFPSADFPRLPESEPATLTLP